MKSTKIIFGTMLVFIIFFVAQSRESYANIESNFLVYNCIEVKEGGVIIIDNTDLKNYQFKEIYQYININSGKLFILGRNENDQLKISLINQENKKSELIKEYPVDINWATKEAKFYLLSVSKNKNMQLPIIVVEYVGGNIARDIDEREKYLDILYPDGDNKYKTVGNEKISRNNISFEIMTELSYKYFYIGVDHSMKGPAIIQPARLESVKIQFSDCNWDGYPDVLIWKTVSYSRLIEEKNKPDFPFDHEELSVMYYLPQEKKFTKPMSVE